jgi:apolipoprotein D and lipocalin family protein
MKAKTLFSLFLVAITTGVKSQPLLTVDSVDIYRYSGRWYEIASYPATFQKGCRCTTAEYEVIPHKECIRVTNRCIRYKNDRLKLTVANAKAYPQKGSNNSKLKVQFFWPFRGDYYIIGLAKDYSWAVIGHPERKYLWIISRESFMPARTYNEILNIIADKGYNCNRLVKTPQNCDIVE